MMPRGLAVLFFTELWERFSYYGMRALLILFMVAPVAAGGLGMGVGRAAQIYGNYTMAVYLLAIPGGFIADRFLGAHAAVLTGGLIVASGHFALALSIYSPVLFYAGLILVVLGTGLIKPNITTMVGSLFAPGDPRRDAGFSIFHMGINLGSWLAPIVTGFLAQSASFKRVLQGWGFDPNHSWHWGFGAAGVGMLLGLLNYVLKRRTLEGLGGPPPAEARGKGVWLHAGLVLAGCAVVVAIAFVSDIQGLEWLRGFFLLAPAVAVALLIRKGDIQSGHLAAIGIFAIVSMIFWTVCEQAGSTVVLFGDRYTRTELFGWDFPSAWFQSLNPFFIVLLAPVFAWLWPRLGSREPSTPIKFFIGLVFLALSMLLMIPAAMLTIEGKISPLWIVGLFLLQTLGELCIAPIGQSVTTKLASPRIVGLAMGFWLLSLSWGNKLAGAIASIFGETDAEGRAGFFLSQAAFVGVCLLLLIATVPLLRRLMAPVR